MGGILAFEIAFDFLPHNFIESICGLDIRILGGNKGEWVWDKIRVFSGTFGLCESFFCTFSIPFIAFPFIITCMGTPALIPIRTEGCIFAFTVFTDTEFDCSSRINPARKTAVIMFMDIAPITQKAFPTPLTIHAFLGTHSNPPTWSRRSRISIRICPKSPLSLKHWSSISLRRSQMYWRSLIIISTP